MPVEPIPMDDYTRRHVLLVTRDRDEALAEVERLRDVIGEMYVQRGKEPHILRNAIRRAFFDSRKPAER